MPGEQGTWRGKGSQGSAWFSLAAAGRLPSTSFTLLNPRPYFQQESLEGLLFFPKGSLPRAEAGVSSLPLSLLRVQGNHCMAFLF